MVKGRATGGASENGMTYSCERSPIQQNCCNSNLPIHNRGCSLHERMSTCCMPRDLRLLVGQCTRPARQNLSAADDRTRKHSLDDIECFNQA